VHVTPSFRSVALTMVTKDSWFTPVVESTYKGFGDPNGLSQCTQSKHRLQDCRENASISWAIWAGKLQRLEGYLWGKSLPLVKQHSDQCKWPALRESCGGRNVPSPWSFSRNNVRILNHVEHGEEYSLYYPMKMCTTEDNEAYHHGVWEAVCGQLMGKKEQRQAQTGLPYN